MIHSFFLKGTEGQCLFYLDNRLQFRRTFLQWNQQVLPPISDELGLEQGNKNSGEFYVSYSSEHLTNAQDSGLGVKLMEGNPFSGSSRGMEVGYIGQADDVVLLSNDLFLLKNLLELSKTFCKKYHVVLAPDKTKLVAFHTKKQTLNVEIRLETTSLDIEGLPIEVSDTAEYVKNLLYVNPSLS